MLSGVVYAVPRHDLGSEVKGKFQEALDDACLEQKAVDVWRGADAEDPDSPQDETGRHLLMCRSAHLKDARLAMVTFQSLCQGSDGSRCPHFNACGYRKQITRKPPDVLVVTHALLFGPRPQNIPAANLIVIDEAPPLVEEKQVDAKFLEGKIVARTMSDDGCLKRLDRLSDELAANLTPLRNKLTKAIDMNGPGPIKLVSLKTVGLTAELCRSARDYEWKRIVHPPKAINVSDNAALEKILRPLAVENAEIGKIVELWEALRDYLAKTERDQILLDCGRVAVEMHNNGNAKLIVRLVKTIHKDWQCEIIHADATLREQLAGTVLPGIQVVADIQVSAPHQKVILKVGKSFSHTSLKAAKSTDRPGNGVNQIERLLVNLNASAVLTKGKTVAIVPKFVKQTIRREDLWIHPRLAFMHHGAISGIDEHSDCERLIIVGRPLPNVSTIEGMAGGITGLMPQIRLQGSYVQDCETVFASNGQSAVMKRWRHPDRLCDELLKSICDDQLIQAIGRARGVNRTEANPVIVELWGEVVPEGVQIDAIEYYADASKDEEAMAVGLWVSNASHLSKLWPHLGSENAIKKARQQQSGQGERLGSFSYIISFIGKGPPPPAHLGVADYQLKGAGQKTAKVIWDPVQVSDSIALLEKKLGPLVKFEIRSEQASETLH